jgi:peptidoglycan biosynthesis protein MviN/MurJ (putative lipid II flippase)
LRLGLDLLASGLALVSLFFFARRQDMTATRLALFGTAFTISTVVLLTFYLDQFGAISSALYQFFVLLTATSYKRWRLS